MYDPQQHHRHSIRLQGYDYAQSCACFITICTQNRRMMFGHIAGGKMALNDAGNIVQDVWYQIQGHFPHVITDEFVIMPNHIHGILMTGLGGMIDGAGGMIDGEGGMTPPLRSLNSIGDNEWCENRVPTIGQIVGYFKYVSTKKINEIRNSGIQKIWQRNYYEHIIRNESELAKIHKYIQNNPLNWQTDKLHHNNPP